MTRKKRFKPFKSGRGRALLVVAMLYPVFFFAQTKYTISGVVKDVANGETVLGATVFLKGTSIAGTTNEYGFYSITAPEGNYTLTISYLGFTTYEMPISLNSDQKLDIELTEDATELNEVVITAEQSKKVDLRTPQMSVAKLSTSDIKKIPVVLGEVDLIKSIQLLPGVANAGEGASLLQHASSRFEGRPA